MLGQTTFSNISFYWSRKRGLEEVCGCMFAKYLYLYSHVFASWCICIGYCRWKRENKRCGCVFVFATYWVKHQTLSSHHRESNTICFLGLFYFFFSGFVFWLIYSKYLTQAATITKSHTLLLQYYFWFVVFAFFKPISNVKYYFFLGLCVFPLFVCVPI